MDLTCKVQIHPGKEVQGKLWQVSRLCNHLANAMIEQRRDPRSWGNVSKYSQKQEIRDVKKEFPGYKIPASQVLQEVAFGVDRGYQSFFSKRRQGDQEARPPGFRSSKEFFTQTYPQAKTSFRIEDGQLALAYGSKPSDWLQIPIPELKVTNVKTVKIKRDEVSGKWYALFSYQVNPPAPKAEGHTIYFDPGCKTSLTGIKTDGQLIEYDFNPLRKINRSTYELIDSLKSKRDKIKNRNQKVWRRLNRRIKGLYAKIVSRSKTYLHTLGNKILGDHPDVKYFKVGDWDKRKTLADTGNPIVNRSINRVVQNNNPLGKLFEILVYKAKLRGQTVQKFEEKGSTRTCSRCGHIHKDGIAPGKRIFVCQKCNFEYPRDHHSCLNFIKRYESVLWKRLPEILSGRSLKVELAPFSFKPQCSVRHVGTLPAS